MDKFRWIYDANKDIKYEKEWMEVLLYCSARKELPHIAKRTATTRGENLWGHTKWLTSFSDHSSRRSLLERLPCLWTSWKKISRKEAPSTKNDKHLSEHSWPSVRCDMHQHHITHITYSTSSSGSGTDKFSSGKGNSNFEKQGCIMDA